MKQKLPEKKSSYKNSYLGEIRKTKILSKSWGKYSLIGLLIAKFLRKKKLINSFDFRIISISCDLNKNKNLILNTLILFALPFFTFIYSSTSINVVERNNFNLTKIQKQNYSNYIGIYKNSFRSLNKFNILLHNVFEKKDFSKNYSIFTIVPVHEKKEEMISQNLKNYFFYQPFPIDKFEKNIALNKISRNIARNHTLKNNIESDNIGINLWKFKKYYSKFLLNHFLPSNLTYNMIHQNYSMNKKISYKLKEKWSQSFLEFSYSLLISFKLKNFLSFFNCIELEKDLIGKNTKLDLLIEKFNKIENQKVFNSLLLLSDQDNNNHQKNKKSSNFYKFIKINYQKYLSQSLLLKNSYLKEYFIYDSKRIYKKNIMDEYFKYWEKIVKKSFIYNIQNIKYKKRSLQVYEQLYKINNSLNIFYFSKRFVPSFFQMESPKILKSFFRNSNSKKINEIFNSLQIFINTYFDIEQNNLFNESDRVINKKLVTNFELTRKKDINNLIASLFLTATSDEIIMNLLSQSARNNSTKNNKLFLTSNYKLIFANYLTDFQLNYNKQFLYHWKEIDIKNNNRIIYSQFIKYCLKYNRFNPVLKIKYLFSQKKISQFAQLRINNVSLSRTSKNLNETKFLYFYDFSKELVKQNNLYLLSNLNNFFFKQEINKIKTIFNYKFFKENLFVESDSKNIVNNILPYLSNTKIKSYYNKLRSKSSIRSEKINIGIFQSINKFFLYSRSKYFKLTDFKYRVANKILRNMHELYKYNQIENFNFFARSISTSFKIFNYISWFFTSEWWEYNINVLVDTFGQSFLIIGSYFEYSIDNNIKLIRQNLISLWERKNLYNLNLKWNSRLFYCKEKIILNLWSDLQLINNWNSFNWIIFSLIAFLPLFYQNWFSIFIGSDSVCLWKYLETIKYLTDTSRAFYFTKLSHYDRTNLNKTENLIINFFTNLKHYVRNIRFYLLTKKSLSKWLISNKSLDLSRRKRNLLVQSLITNKRIEKYGFQYYHKVELNNKLFGYRGNSQQGLSYLRYLVGSFRKKWVNNSLHLADKWIFFAYLQKLISSQTLQQANKFNPIFRKIPIPLQLGLSFSKGVLLIGPIETGRSYLIKNLVADSYVPLLGISINKLLYNKPDIVTESWMNILIESLRRLNLTLDLAKEMSPCIIWIRNIHQLDVNRLTQNIESDPTFLLGILLKHFQTFSGKTQKKNNIIMIGSTHIPKKIDPSLISPDRLDRIINIRLFNTYQRRNLFPILLNKSNLQLKRNILYFNYFESRTMGYNIRDLAALTNEISLISLTKNKSFVYDDIIKLAFHRQVLGFTHTNNKPDLQHKLKTLLYKIGRAVIQNILTQDSAINPLNISNYLWKRKFYYLSKWYSEPSINESIIKESTILVHVLSCLAGIAARDSWFLLEKDSDASMSLEKSVENDLELAFSILETFSIDFSWLETCETRVLNYKRKTNSINFLSIMHNGIFAIANKKMINTPNDFPNKFINRKNCEFKNTAWSPRFWRLSFLRSHLFDWIKRPQDFELSQKNNFERKNHYDQFLGNKKQLFYERILPRVRKRNVEELEEQFEEILLEEQFEILGFFCSSPQYQMEYQLNNKPRLFIGKRILWDPLGSLSQFRHFIFSRRGFFLDEEMLRRLYITYGVRRERERSLSTHRIKKFFIYRGYNKDLINKLSSRWWSQSSIDQKQNIDTIKRIEKIGIRLKRPQIFTPVYLYQRWLIENIPEKFSRFELLTHRDRWIKINNLLLNDSFTYTILLESYQYLFEFFLSNKILLTQMTKTLLRKKWIFQNEIEEIIHNRKKY